MRSGMSSLNLKSRRRRGTGFRSRRLIRVDGRRKESQAAGGRHPNPVDVRGRVRDKGRVRRGNSSNRVRRRVESQGKGRPPSRKTALIRKLPSGINVIAGHRPRCSTLFKAKSKKMPA